MEIPADALSEDSPLLTVQSFIELLREGDVAAARLLLTDGLNSVVDRDRADLVGELGFLIEPGWGYSARRRRNEDGTEIVKLIYMTGGEIEVIDGPTTRTTYPILMANVEGFWRIASLGKETL